MYSKKLSFDGEAKAAQYLSSGRAQAHPVALILDIHVS